MTRPALTGPTRPGRSPLKLRWPARSRTTVALVRTDTIVVEPPVLAALSRNPAVQILHARLVSPYQYKAVVRWPDRAAPAPKRAPAFAVTLDPQAARILRGLAWAAAWLLAAVAAATVTGGLVWHLFGEELTAAAKILAAAAGVAVVVAGAVWLLALKVGGCPGIHCPGCRHH